VASTALYGDVECGRLVFVAFVVVQCSLRRQLGTPGVQQRPHDLDLRCRLVVVVAYDAAGDAVLLRHNDFVVMREGFVYSVSRRDQQRRRLGLVSDVRTSI